MVVSSFHQDCKALLVCSLIKFSIVKEDNLPPTDDVYTLPSPMIGEWNDTVDGTCSLFATIFTELDFKSRSNARILFLTSSIAVQFNDVRLFSDS